MAGVRGVGPFVRLVLLVALLAAAAVLVRATPLAEYFARQGMLVLASFITASVVFREFGATVWWLGVLMGVGIVGAIIVRLLQGNATES